MISVAEKVRFKELVKTAEEMMKEVNLEIPLGVNYSVNGRLSRTLGRCTISTIEGAKIEIAEYYFKGNRKDDNDIATISTILHEMCHTLPHCFNHGPEWKSKVDKLNRRFGLNIKRTNKSSMSCKEERYAGKETVRIACKNGCLEDIILSSSSMNKRLEKYTCNKCKGAIIRL